ncbi:MAG: hypothetical protein GF421_03640 [Candidatus Aminicenantes bacterium]|nr:hypothetical protein [Candidatus Aminicenantes bacterium]
MKPHKKILISLILIPGLFINLSGKQISRYKKAEPEKGYLLETVPFQKWKKKNFCGPAAMAMVLSYWKDQKQSQTQIAAGMHDFKNKMAYNSEMVFYPRSVDMMSYSFNGDVSLLKKIIKMDIPLIVLHKPVKQINKGHYRVVIGFDENSSQIIFHDPLLGEKFAAEYETFNDLWSWDEDVNKNKWTLAVIPNDIEFPSLELESKYLTYINLATSHYRKTEYEKSLPFWEAAHQENPKEPYPVYSTAMTYIRMDNPKKALQLAKKALLLDKNNAFSLDVLGLTYYKMGKLEESLNILSQALKIAPEEEFIRNHYIVVRDNYIKSHKKKRR